MSAILAITIVLASGQPVFSVRVPMPDAAACRQALRTLDISSNAVEGGSADLKCVQVPSSVAQAPAAEHDI